MSVKAIVFRGALVLLFSAAGCSDDSAGSADDFLAKVCDEYMDCCVAAGRPSDGAQCRAFYSAFVSKSGYDESAATGCLKELQALGDSKCNGSTDTPSCSKVFSTEGGGGSKKPGEACDTDADCATPSEGEARCATEFMNGASTKRCEVSLPGKAGSTPCLGTVDGNSTFYSGQADATTATGYLCDVEDGLSCDGATKACKPIAVIGEPCSGGTYACVASAYCDSTSSACKAKLALGATCRSANECPASAYCDSTDQTCQASRADGEACTTSAQCKSDECTNQKCEPQDNLTLTFLCGTP